MNKFLMLLAAAGTLAVASPAAAQVGIYAGPGGVEVGVGSPGYHRQGYRGYARRDCRTERVEVVRPNGRVIVKTRRICN
jgi:hypothetical protein